MEHTLYKRPLEPPYPAGYAQAMFGMGCFWGAEKRFWELDPEGNKIHITAVGYAGGNTQNPSYQEVCTGTTHHNEVVLVVYDPQQLAYTSLLKTFWESHDPTQGMRQGNDVGSQYRSGIYCYSDEQMKQALASREQYQKALDQSHLANITTEILPAPDFYFAEEYHQQYLDKNPNGYCGLGGTGVCL